MWCLNIGIYWNRISSMVGCDMIHRYSNSSILQLRVHQYLKIIATRVRSTGQITQNKRPAVQFFSDFYHRGLSLRSFASPGWVVHQEFSAHVQEAQHQYMVAWTCGCGAWSDLAAFSMPLYGDPCNGTLARSLVKPSLITKLIDFHYIAWDRFPWASHEEAWHGFLMLFGSSG